MKISSLTKSSLCLALVAGLSGNATTRLYGQLLTQQTQGVASESGFTNRVQTEEVQPLMRGPLHEAFAEQFSQTPEPSEVIGKEPPPAIEELPPEYKPEGGNIQWIPGYWGWDVDTNDFIWVTGLWRNVPPDQQWIPGYWTEVGNGWQWISGFWTAVATQELVYLPFPPAPVESGPSSPPPGDNYFWRPGNWVYQDGGYVWQAGFWAPGQQDWVWAPARYVWTPSGAIYRTGYWDYEVVQRGTVFCPVVFQPSYRQAFRPTYVVEIGPTWFANLFVAPQRNHYYFGNYYAYHGNTPIYPWVEYQRPTRGFDPLYAYYAHQSRNVKWLTEVTRIHQQIANTPSLQSQRTVFAQLQSLSGLQGPRPSHSLRVAQLQSLVQGSNADFRSAFRFASLDQASQRRVQSAIAPSRAFTDQRRDLERDTSSEARRPRDGEDRRGRGDVADNRGEGQPRDNADRDSQRAQEFREIKRLTLKPKVEQAESGIVPSRLEVAGGQEKAAPTRNEAANRPRVGSSERSDAARPASNNAQTLPSQASPGDVTRTQDELKASDAIRGRGRTDAERAANSAATTEELPRQEMRAKPRIADENRVRPGSSDRGLNSDRIPPALNRPDVAPTLPVPNRGKTNGPDKPVPSNKAAGSPKGVNPAKPSDVKPTLPPQQRPITPTRPHAPDKPSAKLPQQQPSAASDRVQDLRLPNVPKVEPRPEPRTDSQSRPKIDGMLLPGAPLPHRPNMSRAQPSPGSVPSGQAKRGADRASVSPVGGENGSRTKINGKEPPKQSRPQPTAPRESINRQPVQQKSAPQKAESARRPTRTASGRAQSKPPQPDQAKSKPER